MIPFGKIAMSSLYFSEQTGYEYCKYIQKERPDYLRGYPAFIYQVAIYADEHKINLRDIVKGIELTSENIMPYQIEKMKNVFGAQIYLQYGHTEACICAYTIDETFRYRVEPLYGYVEILNDDGNHVKIGEMGEVVVTSLHHFAMPLIRYKTGDYAEYGGCDDRYLYLNHVYGRTQDYIISRDNKKILLTALIFGQHFHAMGHMNKWQVEQFKEGEVILNIIKSKEYTEADEEELRGLFEKLGNVKPSFNYVEDIPLTPRGKSKMLVQHIDDKII